MIIRHRCLTLLLAAALLVGCDVGEDSKSADKSDKSAKPAKPETVKVEKGPIKVQGSFKGVFEASETKELALSPKAWTPDRQGNLMVARAVEHGAAVKKGDVVVQFDLEKIDQAILDLKAERALSQIAIRQAEADLPILEKSAPLDLAEAERNKKQADEDLKKFLELEKPLSVDMADHVLRDSTHSLEAAREELKQLQKMYRDKDLTEETEEFILKRQKHQVYMSEFYLKLGQIQHDETLRVTLPRREQTARALAATQAVALDKARGQALTLRQKRLALEKLKYDDDRTADRLKDLEADRESMTVRAPADGIAYHGRCTQGQWSTDASKLRRGSTMTPEEVFMTIVSARPLFVRATVEEKDFYLVRPQQKGKAVPTGFPDMSLPAQVTDVAAVPHSAGNFYARFAVELGQGDRAIMPGMGCAVKVVGYQKDDALLAPSASVFAEDGDEDAHYVYVPTAAGGNEKRTVKVGKTSGSKTEILEGLRAGDEILKNKP